MKKILVLITLSFFINNFSYSFTKGKGEIKMSEKSIEHFINYIQGNSGIKKKPEFDFKPRPDRFVMSSNGNWTFAWYCPYTQCSFQDSTVKTIKDCERDTGVSCGVFASRRTIYWDNGTNTKTNKAKFKSKMSGTEIRAKLKDYGFIGQITKKVEKKLDEKIKVVKKKESKGNRSIAFSWEGYEEIIIGTVGYEESDDGKTSMSLKLPNNDGSCEGTYLLQNGGKGTWLVACSNNMGAAGTLNWNDDGSVTGSGRDYKDKKVKFTVAKQS